MGCLGVRNTPLVQAAVAKEEEQSCVSERVHPGKRGCDEGDLCFINRRERASSMMDIPYWVCLMAVKI